MREDIDPMILRDDATTSSSPMSRAPGLLALMAAGLSACAPLGPAEPGAAAVTGTAAYRERMALPPQAVFEATIEDVSRADAPSIIVGRTRIEAPSAPPIRFSIAYDPARVEAAARYVVRARITLDDRLVFTTATSYPVLGAGAPRHVDVLLRRVDGGAAASGPRRMSGIYTYQADAGFFVDCSSGERLPVAHEGDNAALEAAYVSARPAPGAPVLVTVDALVAPRAVPDRQDTRPTLIVSRFISLSAQACDAVGGSATLENTYWKLLTLGVKPVEVVERQREPHLILQPAQKRIAGSGGCNRLIGSYTLAGEQLAFGRVAATMMACPQGMETERAFLDALTKVAQWRADGQRLTLLSAGGEALAQFESRPIN